MGMAKEKRMFPRANLTCRISVILDFRILVFNSEIENIGEGGIRVTLDEKLPVSTPLTLEISVTDKKIYIKCKGEVIWANEKKLTKDERYVFDTGIKFTNLSNSKKEEIRSLVTSFFSKSSEA